MSKARPVPGPTIMMADDDNEQHSASETWSWLVISFSAAALMIRGVIATFHDLVSYLS